MVVSASINLKFIALFALVIFQFTNVIASEVECKNVDLRDSSVVGPVRNQGSLGWCFAYAAADLYGHALKKRISPIDIALSYYQDNPNYSRADENMMTSYRAGRQDYVFNTVLRHGVCLDNKVSAFRQDAPERIIEIERLANRISEFTGSSSERRNQTVRLIQSNFHLLNGIFPTSNYSTLRDAFLELDSSKAPLVSLVDNICGNRIPVDHLRMRGGRFTPDGSVNQIRNIIGNAKRPVLIGYNAALLRNPSLTDTRINHVSTIMGTRVFKGQCQYLLKNSWGGNNTSYHWPLRTVWASDNGHTWISESLIRKMTKEVRWVQKVY